jgi:hypothetical protein
MALGGVRAAECRARAGARARDGVALYG